MVEQVRVFLERAGHLHNRNLLLQIMLISEEVHEFLASLLKGDYEEIEKVRRRSVYGCRTWLSGRRRR